jgi:signal peptidase I
MKRIIYNWILPIIISIGLVLICRLFFFETLVVSENNMEYTLNKGDRLFFSKISKLKRNRIVSTSKFGISDKKKIYRIIGIPGDSILISNSFVYVNNKKILEEAGVSYIYTFNSDYRENVHDILMKNRVNYDEMLAPLSFYRVQADISILKKLKSDKSIKSIKREIEERNINTGAVLASEYLIYWNKDHLGPILIPSKGLTIELDLKSFVLYKELIQNETGLILTNKSGSFYLSSNHVKSYTFKQNYYFLMNDNRSNASDSRFLGLVPEGKINSTFLFKLPW